VGNLVSFSTGENKLREAKNRALGREHEFKGHEAMGGWIIVMSYVNYVSHYYSNVITMQQLTL
jgi:hypothetical protein